MLYRKDSVVLYGCGYEAEKFLINYPDIKIDYCIDDKLYGKTFHNKSIYKPQEKKKDLVSKYVVIFANNVNTYSKIAEVFKVWGLKEFEHFIPYNVYGKKIALTWGNCHVEYIKRFLSYSKEFSEEYAFYNKKNLWDMKEADLNPELFAHCDLLVCQHIREENSLNRSFSSKNIEGMLKKDTVILKFPNLFGLPKFLFPQTCMDGMYIATGGAVRWYKDRIIDDCINSNIVDVEAIYKRIQEIEFDKEEIDKAYNSFLEKLYLREQQCNIHIQDYIEQHLRDEKLFLDIEHPSKTLLGEIGNRILEWLGYQRLDKNLIINYTYGHEVVTYPSIKKIFGMTWEDEDLKSDNISEKLLPVYMDMKEYIQQYCQIYQKKKIIDNRDIRIMYSLLVEKKKVNEGGKEELFAENGEISGTVLQAKRCSAIKIYLDTVGVDLEVEYRVYLHDLGWTEYCSSNELCGTEDFLHYIQAIQIRLVGKDAEKYSIKYQVHCQSIGWMECVENNEIAGNTDKSLRLEAIKIYIDKINTDINKVSTNFENKQVSIDKMNSLKKLLRERDCEKYQSTYLEVGDFTYGVPRIKFNRNNNERITIGKFCSIGPDVTIFGGGNHRTDWVTTYPFVVFLKDKFGYIEGYPDYRKKGVVIGNDVWIGANAKILSGVTVGDGAVIGTGAIITKNVEPYSIVAGNPGKLIRYRFEQEVVKKLLEMKWWDWNYEHIYNVIPLLESQSIDELYNYFIQNKENIK